jgi:uncharacterized protein YcfJ
MQKRRWAALLGMVALVGSMHAESIEYTTWVKVQKSVPEYERVTQREPYEECWTQRVPVTYTEGGRTVYREGDRTAAGIIGGVAGGILGHQIVHSRRAKGAATIGGAILGTLAGQNMAAGSRYREPARTYVRYETRRECSTRYETKRVREFRGYKNIAWYKGRKIVKYSDRPLKKIPLTVTISY